MDKDTLRILDGMADFETRILLLENLHTPADCSREIEALEIVAPITKGIAEMSNKEAIERLQAFTMYLQKKINEHTDIHKVKAKGNKYASYTNE